MKFIDKKWAKTQFDNFSIRIDSVFAKVSSLKPVALSGKYTDLVDRITLTNNLLATEQGTALDAAVGPLLKEPLDAVTRMVSCVSPNSKDDVLNVILEKINLFDKSSMIPFRIFTSGKKLGESVSDGNYLGMLEYYNGNIIGFLTNHWNPANRLCIAVTLYTNPQQISIKFENFEFFSSHIVKIKDQSVNLNEIGWVRSAGGMYYSRFENILPKNVTVLSCNICGWGQIRATDFLQAYILSDVKGVGIMSNTNTFIEGSTLFLRTIYL